MRAGNKFQKTHVIVFTERKNQQRYDSVTTFSAKFENYTEKLLKGERASPRRGIRFPRTHAVKAALTHAARQNNREKKMNKTQLLEALTEVFYRDLDGEMSREDIRAALINIRDNG